MEKTGKQVQLNILEVKNPEIEAQLVAQGIAEQLSSRVSFRRAMRKGLYSWVEYTAEAMETRSREQAAVEERAVAADAAEQPAERREHVLAEVRRLRVVDRLVRRLEHRQEERPLRRRPVRVGPVPRARRQQREQQQQRARASPHFS